MNHQTYYLIHLSVLVCYGMSSSIGWAETGSAYAVNTTDYDVKLFIQSYVDSDGRSVKFPRVGFTIPSNKNANLSANGKNIIAERMEYSLVTSEGETFWTTTKHALRGGKLRLPITREKLRTNRVRFSKGDWSYIYSQHADNRVKPGQGWGTAQDNVRWQELEFTKEYIELLYVGSPDFPTNEPIIERIYQNSTFARDVKAGSEWVSTGEGGWNHGYSDQPYLGNFAFPLAQSSTTPEYGTAFIDSKGRTLGEPGFNGGVFGEDSPTPEPPTSSSQSNGNHQQHQEYLKELRKQMELDAADAQRRNMESAEATRKLGRDAKERLEKKRLAEAKRRAIEKEERDRIANNRAEWHKKVNARNVRIENEAKEAELTRSVTRNLSKDVLTFGPKKKINGNGAEQTYCNDYVRAAAKGKLKHIPQEMFGRANQIFDQVEASTKMPGSPWTSAHDVGWLGSEHYRGLYGAPSADTSAKFNKQLQQQMHYAQMAANRGKFVIAIWKNPKENRSGHVVVVTPTPKNKPFLTPRSPAWKLEMPYVSGAGRRIVSRLFEDGADGVFSEASMAWTFSSDQKNVRFFIYGDHNDDLFYKSVRHPVSP